MEKFRMKNWYWGNYATKRGGRIYDDRGYLLRINNCDLEPYDEESHGWHNSEEWKERKQERYTLE